MLLTLWCLMPLSSKFHLYHSAQFYGGGNWREPPIWWKSLTNYRLVWEGFKLTTLVLQLYHSPQFYGGGNRREPPTWWEYLTNYHLMLYRVHLVWEGLYLTTLVTIGTDYTGRSNILSRLYLTTLVTIRTDYTGRSN
jgi:hypothetical protein